MRLTNIGARPSLRKRLGGSTVMILTVCVNGQRLVLESRAGWVINYFSAWLLLRRRHHLKSGDASKLFLTSKYIWKIFVSSTLGGLVALYSYHSGFTQRTETCNTGRLHIFQKNTANIGDSGGLIQHGSMHILWHPASCGLVYHDLVHQDNGHFGDLKHLALVLWA